MHDHEVRHRHRVPVPRLERALRAEWRAVAAAQWALIAGAGALIAAVWAGLGVPRWVITAAAVLLVVYALGVLSRGRPRAPEPGDG